MIRKSLLTACCLAFVLQLSSLPNAHSQALGAAFGSREPTPCPSRKFAGPPTAAQARALFICETEKYVNGYVYLVSDVSVEIAKPRPYSAWYDSGHGDIDVEARVYPIQGHFSDFQCSRRDAMLGQDPNKNCMRIDFPNATGTCYKSTFGEWHCSMGGGTTTTAKGFQAPPA